MLRSGLGRKRLPLYGKERNREKHTRLLMVENFPGCELLNDDNPIVRIEKEGIAVYGTPWSGKTTCYRNLQFTVGGIVRLVQAPHNRFIRQEEVDAFITVLPGCAVFPQAELLHKNCVTH